MRYVLAASLLLFSTTSLMSQWYFGFVGLNYMFGRTVAEKFKYIFPCFCIFGATLKSDMVWTIQDIALGLLTLPNLIAMVFLWPKVLQSSKHFIAEARDSEFFPYLLDGIHLRRIRWNVKQLYVFRDMKLVRLVPCCTITTQQNQIIRVLLGQFLKKYVHTSRIAIRHNKKTGASRYWFNSSVCIPIFTNVMERHRWTHHWLSSDACSLA